MMFDDFFGEEGAELNNFTITAPRNLIVKYKKAIKYLDYSTVSQCICEHMRQIVKKAEEAKNESGRA